MALGESFAFEIGADITAARERLDALSARLGNLKTDVAQVDGQEISVETDSRQIEQAREEVETLQRAADRGIDIDVDVDQNRNAARAADDVRRMGVNAEGLQRGIGPLRGFTDELSGASATGGMAANALIDAGEAVEIFGSQLGLSEAALGRWSLALGGIGIAAGIAIPLIAALADNQSDVAEQTDEANSRLREQTGLLDQIDDRLADQPSIFDALLPEDDRDEIIRAFGSLGLGIDDIDAALIAVNNNGREFAAQRLEMAGLASDEADALAKVIEEFNDYDNVLIHARGAGIDFAHDNEQLIRSLQQILEAGKNIDESQLLSDFLADVNLYATQAQIDAVTAALGRLENASDAEKLAAAFEAYEAAADSAASNPAWRIIGDQIDKAIRDHERYGTSAEDAADVVEEATKRVVDAWDRVLGRFDTEEQLLDIGDQFERVLEAAGEVAAAQQDDSKDALEAAEEYRRELIKLAREVVDYARSVDDVPEEKVTQLIAAIDEGDLTEIQLRLADLTRDKTIRFKIDVENPGPIKFTIDPETGAPSLQSGGANIGVVAPSVTSGIGSPSTAGAGVGGGRLGGDRITNNTYVLGQDPVVTAQQRRDYAFRNGDR